MDTRLSPQTEEGPDPMTMPADASEQRKLHAVARRYRRDGYRVTVPARSGKVPSFLEGFTPDLIAESGQDRVVVEIKRSDAVQGSNELQRVAETVAREPGWRFELVTVASPPQVVIPTSERIASIGFRAQQVASLGMTDIAYMYAWSALEMLLNDLALQQGIKVSKVPFVQAVRELASRGVIEREVLNAVEQARAVRNRVLHAGTEILPSDADVEELLLLGRTLRSQLAAVEAEREAPRASAGQGRP